MYLINLFHLLFMGMNNSNGKYKGLTQDLLLGPLSLGLICEELLFLQMGYRSRRTGFPPVTKTFVRSSLSSWAAFPWPVCHTDAHVSTYPGIIRSRKQNRISETGTEGCQLCYSGVFPSLLPLLSDQFTAQCTLQQAPDRTDKSRCQSVSYLIIVRFKVLMWEDSDLKLATLRIGDYWLHGLPIPKSPRIINIFEGKLTLQEKPVWKPPG